MSDFKERYKRNIQLHFINEEGQKNLLCSSVMVVGCGAVGSVISNYLCAAGIGRLGIADFDTVDVSNLQRQIFYHTIDKGKPKVSLLANHLESLNPDCKIETYSLPITEENAEEIFSKYDFIIDGSDNAATKKLVALKSCKLEKPYCIGGVSMYRGQVSTFVNHSINYSDIFSLENQQSENPDLTKGVFGPVPGIIGSICAAQALKYLCDKSLIDSNSLITVDLLNLKFETIKI